jgi:ankyrin repeat-rich membrane spanning protein
LQTVTALVLLQDNWSALLCAAKEGYADICLELLEHGADIEHRDMVW